MYVDDFVVCEDAAELMMDSKVINNLKGTRTVKFSEDVFKSLQYEVKFTY